MKMEFVSTSSRHLRKKITKKRYSDDWTSSYASDDEEKLCRRSFNIPDKLTDEKFSIHNFVRELPGEYFTLEYLKENGFKSPILIKEKDGLGLVVPDGKSFTVRDVCHCVGPRRSLDVIEVETQKSIVMSMKAFQNYYENKERTKLLNVISLEFSHTKLDKLVQPPKIVRQIDWVEMVWPEYLKERQRNSTNLLKEMYYPKVQKYVLMSVKDCYTDFHVDFGGSSVWYHVLKGEKVFWLIPPTRRNFDEYRRWVLSGDQGKIFFGDIVKNCQRIVLKAGNTFLMPSGWIHAVFTPEDSIVFGGNFLHYLNMEKQIEVVKLEDQIHVEDKYRFPFFHKMQWYVLEKYYMHWNVVSLLSGRGETEAESSNRGTRNIEGYVFNQISPGVINGLIAIVKFLTSRLNDDRNVPKLTIPCETIISAILELIDAGDKLFSLNNNPFNDLERHKINESLKNVVSHGRELEDVYDSTEKIHNAPKKRRTRCSNCERCLMSNCEACKNCKDMKKYGGPGVIKQCCVYRQCLRPKLPNHVVCVLCNLKVYVNRNTESLEKINTEESEDSETTVVSNSNSSFIDPEHGLRYDALMECKFCLQIIHPGCYLIDSPEFIFMNKINYIMSNTPNSWKCPSCCVSSRSDE